MMRGPVMEWNYDISAAPKGRVEIREYPGPKGGVIRKEVHVPDLIIAASASCRTVTISRWIPKEQRWNMLPEGEDPLAWAPWPPKHPLEDAP